MRGFGGKKLKDMAKRSIYTIDAATDLDTSRVLNGTPSDATIVSISASSTGLDASVDCDFRGGNLNDSSFGFGGTTIGTTLGVSNLSPTKQGFAADFKNDYLIVDISGDSTVGIVTLTVTYK